MAEVFDVFISYRREDGEELAKDLYGFLFGKGVRVFLDGEKLEVGKNFPDQLRGAIRRAPHYVLIGTESAFDFRAENREIGELDFVKEEIRTALEVCKNSDDHTFTVLFADGCEVPKREKLSEDVRKLVDYNSVIEKKTGRTAAFEAILELVTKVKRVNLWHAAHRRLENGKKQDGRFARLRIEESIMPAATEKKDREELPIEVITDKENGAAVPLLDAIKNTKGNLYLIGEGGIGKTTSLIHIMEEAYGKDYSPAEQIPIFVELSFAPDKNGKWIEARKSTFIFRSIYKQIIDRRDAEQGVNNSVEEFDEVFGMDPKVAVKPVKDLFTRESPSPEYLLLLDGLNEVSPAKIKGGDETVIGLVLQEIRYITENCPNVRVILTSRSDESAVPFEGFTRIYLSGVGEKNIEEYLIKSGLPGERIKAAKEDKELMKTLSVPLFLTMYADLKDTVGISTQGEILHAFFHERRDNIYTAQSRLAKISTNFVYSEPSVDKARLSADMQIFILDLILPQIGYDMESNEAFSFSAKRLRESAVKIMKGESKTDECGDYCEDVFPIRGRLGTTESPSKIVGAIIKAFDPKFPSNDQEKTINEAFKAAASAIVKCLADEIGILYRISNNEYGFVHQHFRDYFSAVKYLNVMKLAKYLSDNGEKEEALGLMNAYFKDKPVSLQIRRFIGEIAGEHHNKPYCDNKTWRLPQKESLVMKALDIYRGAERKAAGYGVYSLLHILNESRGELSGCDFSHLDLTGCSINGMRLSRKGLAAEFNGAVINDKDLTYAGHETTIYSLSYSPDGRYILTESEDYSTIVWYAETLIPAELPENTVQVSFHPNGQYVITTQYRDSVKIRETDGFTVVYEFDTSDRAEYSPDGRYIVFKTESGLLRLIDSESLLPVKEFETGSKVVFDPRGDSAAVITPVGSVVIEDPVTLCVFGSLGSANNVCYSPDGERILTADEHRLRIWDSYDLQLIAEKEFEGQIWDAEYGPDGGIIIVWIIDDVSDNMTYVLNADAEELYSKDGALPYAFCPDGGRLAFVDYGELDILETKGYKRIGKIDLDGQDPLSYWYSDIVSYSPDGKKIAVAAGESLTVYDACKGDVICRFAGSDLLSKSVEYSSDGKYLAAPLGKVINVWDMRTYKLAYVLDGHNGDVSSASFSADGKLIASAADDKTVRIWNTETGSQQVTIRENSENYYCDLKYAAFCPDGGSLLICGNNIKVYETEKYTLRGSIDGTAAAYSPDGSFIAAAMKDLSVCIYDSETLEQLMSAEGHGDRINSVSYSPDGRHIVSASDDGTVQVWDANDLKLVKTLEEKFEDYTETTPAAESARFSADGKRIIAIYKPGSTVIWDTSTFKIANKTALFTHSLCCSPDGRYIAAAYEVIEITDAQTYESVETIKNIPGLNFVGADFTQLHPRSEISNREKDVIRQYGGKI